jgi:ribosomal protein S17E
MKAQTSTTILTILLALAGAQVPAAESPTASCAANQVAGYTEEAYEKIKAVQAALRSYWELSGGFPSSELGLRALVASEKVGDPKFKKTKEALPSVPMDPWGRPYTYSATENTMTLATKGPNPDSVEDDGVVIETIAVAGKAAPVVEQVKPVVGLLRSVKESDTGLFQQCWAKPMAERMVLNDESARKVLERYKGGFDQAFGEYNMDEFSFSFTGHAAVGMVTVKFKSKNVPPLHVVKAGNAWKLGEK